MRADAYPWPGEHARAAGLLRWDPSGFGYSTGGADVRGRTPVAAVGSNSSPAVLARKLRALDSGAVWLEPRELPGVGVGHSAHVSAGGYIPAAPFVGSGPARVVVGWFDTEQLALLDATEPNYVRRRLSAGIDGYVSRWGIVAIDGEPVTLTGQRQLLARLRPPAVLAGGRLTDPDVAAEVSAWLRAKHAVDAGWPD